MIRANRVILANHANRVTISDSFGTCLSLCSCDRLGGLFGYFYFLLGEGEGGVRGARKEGGNRVFLIENSRRGGGVLRRGRGRRVSCLKVIGARKTIEVA